jgi:uncharacterized sulfatase
MIRCLRRARIAAAALLCGGTLACSPAPPRAPNLVLIVLDDVASSDVGAFGGALGATPRIDQLAREGTVLRRFYANSPVCSPSRAALLTGRHPSELGLSLALSPRSQRGVPARVPMLEERLRDAGFATGHFGKWHLGQARAEQLPRGRGFDRSVLRPPGGSPFYVDPPLAIDDAAPQRSPGHLTELTTDFAIEFVRANRERPFFANVWYHAPHGPLEPPARFAERFPATRRGRYAALLAHADEQIGRLLAALDELGLASRTLVVLTSDNGGSRNAGSSQGTLRGYKLDVYEGGIRVPAIARWPGRIPAGAANDSVALGYDWPVTIADLFGLDTTGLAPPGRSLRAALLEGARLEREETLFWEIDAAPGEASARHFAARRGRFKLVQQGEQAAPSLFDVESDPGEARDLAGEHPELAAALLAEYHAWRRSVSRIDAGAPALHGAVEARADGFDCDGGRVELAPDDRFEVDDGALSFAARVTPRVTDAKARILAEQPGAWRLSLEGSALELSATPAGGAAPLTLSGGRLAAGAEHAVGFTLHGGRRRRGTELRLFADGALVAHASLPLLGASRARVRLCGGEDAGGAFLGRLAEPRFYVSALEPEELFAGDGERAR